MQQRGGKVAAQAQAQAQRQEEITAVESLELCKALLRVSIYHVSYLRGIFPEDYYKSVDVRNLDNMEIRMLLAKSEESQRMVQWVEGGVADALERRYLRKVFFGFSRDREGKDLLEQYVFCFSYDADGNVHMEAGPGTKHGFSTKDTAAGKGCGKGPTLTAVKYQVCRLMRMLVEVTNTLEKVPEERYLYMKLTYTDDAPDEYEPPMFGPAADSGVGCFSRMPFVMEVGKVDTKHIKVGLAVKTILDDVEAGWEEDCVPVADDNSDIYQQTTSAARTAGPTGGASHGAAAPAASGGRMESCSGGGGGFSCAGSRGAAGAADAREVQQPMAGAVEESAGEAAAPPRASLTQEQRQELESVKQWVLNRPMHKVHVIDCMARFGLIPANSLEAYIAELTRQGVLARTSEADCYCVLLAPEAATAAPSRGGNGAAAAADALHAAEAAMQKLTVAPLSSQQGGVHDVPGSQRTMSCVGSKRKEASEAAGQPEQEWFPETQPSQNAAVRKRGTKASMVQDPIPQTKRARRAPAKEAESAAAAATTRRRSARNVRHEH